MDLIQVINCIGSLDEAAMAAARERQTMLAKPPGSLGKLEALSVQMAGIYGSIDRPVEKKQLLVFAADNGVVAEGVSSAPPMVTLRQTINLAYGKTGAAVLCRHFGCGMTVCDVGVSAKIDDPLILDRKIAYGTGDIAKGPAMSREQAERAVLTGAELAMECQADMIGIGEMGIGNTTTASAVLAVLLEAEAEAVTGRGGGITDEAFARKKQVIKAAIKRANASKDDVLGLMAELGGFDIAAMCGAFLGAAASRRPAVIDGAISAVAALCAVRICPRTRDYLVSSHASYEIGYKKAMQALGLEPMLRLDMRLGEGSGCPLAFQILTAAWAILRDMASFEEAGIDDSYLEPIRQGDKFSVGEKGAESGA